MTQMQIEQLCSEDYSYYLSYGELETEEDLELRFLMQILNGYETCDSDDERKLPQGVKNVRCNERHDYF